MLDLSTSLSLVPSFLAAAYGLKLALTGESYEGEDPRVQRKHAVLAGVATAPHRLPVRRRRNGAPAALDGDLGAADPAVVKARSERSLRILTPTEAVWCALIVTGAAVGRRRSVDRTHLPVTTPHHS